MKLEIHNAKEPIVTNHSVVLITADGRSLHDDLENFVRFEIPHDVYCIGRSIQVVTPPVDHFGDVDADSSVWVAEHLPDKARNGHILRHTLGDYRSYDVDWKVIDAPYDWRTDLWHGSTSLFAVLTCLGMGYECIILAGSPLDFNGHWYDLPGVDGPGWTGLTYRAWLDFWRTEDAKKVRSMSGYTAQFLGRPTKTWLSGLQE